MKVRKYDASPESVWFWPLLLVESEIWVKMSSLKMQYPGKFSCHEWKKDNVIEDVNMDKGMGKEYLIKVSFLRPN